MFPNLKLQIFRRGSHQNQLAKAVGIDESVLSKLLATYLDVDEVWLFERFEVPPSNRQSEDLRAAASKKAADNGDI